MKPTGKMSILRFLCMSTSQRAYHMRFLSVASVLLLLMINIWLILYHLNGSNNQCQKESEDYEEIQKPENPKTVQLQPSRQQVKDLEDATTEVGFNVSLQLGRWDKTRTFKMYDFVTVGSDFPSLSTRFSVCLATQSSIEKLHSIAEVAEHWDGAISAALYAAGDDEYFLLHWYVSFLRGCFATVRLKVSFHLAVNKFRIPTGKIPENLKSLDENHYDCGEYKAVLKRIIRLRDSETTIFRTRSPYPQNLMRNLARKNCQSENVFLTDVDIIPSRGLAENVDKFLKSPMRMCPGKCAYVIPTYELDYRTDFPKDKKHLLRLANKGLARAFHLKVFIYNQYATNFTRWESFPDVSEEVVVSHDVTNFEFLYEPFYVASDSVPEHDERFSGYGYTRNSQVYEMFVDGYTFQVLSPVFTIHWGLQERHGRPIWREQQNSLNHERFEVFKRELFARYRKDPLKMIKD